MNNKDRFFKNLFFVAAIYDFLLGIAFFCFYEPVYKYFNITLPTEPMYLQMAAAFVIAMGVGYFYIYKNLYRNIDLAKLGVVYKFVYSGLISYFYLVNNIHVLFFYFAISDFTFMLLFIWFIGYAKKDPKFLK